MNEIKFVDRQTVELVKHNASDIDVARAAWVSNYGSDAREKDSGRIAGLIKFLYTNNHLSPFEHASFTFFVDTTLAVSKEFMRHRTFSYNEVSGRYKQLEGRFYIPPSERPLIQSGKIGAYHFVPGTEEQYAIMVTDQEAQASDAWRRYNHQLDAGIAKEVARHVFPVNTMTQFYATANPRNVIQFLLLRNDGPALYEIRELGQQIEDIFAEAMPLTYSAYKQQREVWDELKKLLERFDGIENLLKFVGDNS